MIQYLEQLVEEGQYQQVLTYAETLLLSQDHSPRELLMIKAALLKARCELNEYQGALVSGRLAIRLALDLEEWDYFGTSAFLLGPVYIRLQQPEVAISTCLEYLENLHKYARALKYETTVWFNLGMSYMALGDSQEATKNMWKALEISERKHTDRDTHGIRHGLVYMLTKLGDYRPIPGLLAKCAHYLRHHPEASRAKESWFWHYIMRAEFAAVTNRVHRAEAVARRGLFLSHNLPEQQFFFYMVLARIAQKISLRDAARHSLAARLCAIACRRYDLESESADFLYATTKLDPNAIEELSHDYALLEFAGRYPWAGDPV